MARLFRTAVIGPPLLRAGITHLLTGSQCFEVIIETDDIAAAFSTLSSETIDAVLLDVETPPSKVALGQFTTEYPTVRVIALATSERDIDILGFMRAGISGYVLKDTELNDFIGIVLRILAGESYVPARLARNLLTNPVEELTSRQRQIMDQIALGKANKEIATDLRLAAGSLKMYIAQIFRILKARNRLEAVKIYRLRQLTLTVMSFVSQGPFIG